ncbi:hypothetical protein RB653_007714 [Dictyostelium firmibasis]|uniref:Restriction endonuclease type IV Mrr domain-containing protein n=1 Tax=Dictyostelium firmibasis TaxID=79012 RepID=A0AAN7U1N9_9MYCE
MFRITKLNNYYNKFRTFKKKNIISVTNNNLENINKDDSCDKIKKIEKDHLNVKLQIIKDDEYWRTKNWFELKFDEEIDKKEILKNNKNNLELLKEIKENLKGEEEKEEEELDENSESEDVSEKIKKKNKISPKTIVNIKEKDEPKIKLLRVKKIEIKQQEEEQQQEQLIYNKKKNEKNKKNEEEIIYNDNIYRYNIEEKEEEEEEEEEVIEELSTYSKGKKYELKTIEILNQFGMNIIRSGGKNDKGIDFKGDWKLPSKKVVKIIGQCKNYSGKKVGPSVIREFESTFIRYQSELDKENSKLLKQDKTSTLGIIVSQSGFSPSIRSFSEEIEYPVVLCHLLDYGILSFYMNFKAKQLLPNIRVARRKNIETDQFTLDLAYDNN